jgi:hypothetical protein
MTKALKLPLWGQIRMHKGIFCPEWYPYGDGLGYIRASLVLNGALMWMVWAS